MTAFNFTPITKTRNWRKLVERGVILPPETEPSYYGYKEPLRPVKEGFGYMGVVTGNKERTHVQCHICGFYYSYLGKHLLTHKTNAKEYKKTFGLSVKTSLIGEELRRKRIQAQLAVPPELRERRRQQMTKLGRSRKSRKGHGTKHSLEKKNQLGLCPDQILDRIQKLAVKMGRTPRMIDYMKHYKSGGGHIVGTYGTWDNAVRLSGLQVNPVGQANKKYTAGSLLLLVEDFHNRNGRWPSYSDCRRGLIPSAYTWSMYFNGLNKAVEIVQGVQGPEDVSTK